MGTLRSAAAIWINLLQEHVSDTWEWKAYPVKYCSASEELSTQNKIIRFENIITTFSLHVTPEAQIGCTQKQGMSARIERTPLGSDQVPLTEFNRIAIPFWCQQELIPILQMSLIS